VEAFSVSAQFFLRLYFTPQRLAVPRKDFEGSVERSSSGTGAKLEEALRRRSGEGSEAPSPWPHIAKHNRSAGTPKAPRGSAEAHLASEHTIRRSEMRLKGGCGDQLECQWHSSFAEQWGHGHEVPCHPTCLFNCTDFNACSLLFIVFIIIRFPLYKPSNLVKQG